MTIEISARPFCSRSLSVSRPMIPSVPQTLARSHAVSPVTDASAAGLLYRLFILAVSSVICVGVARWDDGARRRDAAFGIPEAP